MTLVVAFLGALIVLPGALGLASPARFRGLFDVLSPQTRYVMAVVIRVSALVAAVFGAYLVYVAT